MRDLRSPWSQAWESVFWNAFCPILGALFVCPQVRGLWNCFEARATSAQSGEFASAALWFTRGAPKESALTTSRCAGSTRSMKVELPAPFWPVTTSRTRSPTSGSAALGYLLYCNFAVGVQIGE